MKNYSYSSGIASALFASLIWSISVIPTKYLGDVGVSVFFELLVRYLFPLLIFLLIFNKRLFKIDKKLILGCILTGVSLFLALILSVYGIRMIEHGSMGILIISLNIIIVPFYFIIVRKKFIPKLILLFSIMALLGVFALTFEFEDPTSIISKGSLLCLLASFLYSAYLISSSYWLRKNDVDQLTLHFYQSLVFVALCIPFLFFTNRSVAGVDFSSFNIIASLLFIGIFSGLISYQLLFFAQRKMPVILVALTLSSQMLFSSLIDIIIFRVQLTPLQVIGYVLIIVAILGGVFANTKEVKFKV